MSFKAKRELLVQVAPRYREASRAQKTLILDEFTAATGYCRKYAVRLLSNPVAPPEPIKRQRERRYGPEAQDALAIAWAAANYICGKRLVPFLPDLVTSLERHGHLKVSDDVRAQLLEMSAATVDRILQPLRKSSSPSGKTTTKRGILLKHRIPVRTFAEWNDVRPGFTEADLVAHCGTSTHGAYLRSLVVTDIATGWTECLALPNGGQAAVLRALGWARSLLPFNMLGLDTDNGSEFINEALIAYCESEQITFTRGRPYRKNDQCFVEQKNGSIVRQLVGYDRYEGQTAQRQLSELYRATRLYVNFFQPSMKLQKKRRTGSKVHRTYDAAQTPFQRLVASGALQVDKAQHLEEVYVTLDPVLLLRQVRQLQDALWKHAVLFPSVMESQATDEASELIARFKANACMFDGEKAGSEVSEQCGSQGAEHPAAGRKRNYRRTGKSLGPRTYRTHPDRFEAVRDEMHGWFLAAPDRTAKSLLEELQAKYPGEFPNSALRTLQRRVSEWRAQAIIEFDDSWLEEDPLAAKRQPPALRATVISSGDAKDADRPAEPVTA